MTYLTRDNRFREVYEQEQKGEVIHNMCEVLDKIEARGREAGLQAGQKAGREEGLRAMIAALKEYIAAPEELWNTIIKNAPYQNVTLQQIEKYFE